MGLWTRLFGARETPEQRLERARRHLRDGEYEHAVRALMGVEGDDAEAVRAEARQLIERRDERAERRAAQLAAEARRGPTREDDGIGDDERDRDAGRGDGQRGDGGPYREAAAKAQKRKQRKQKRKGGEPLMVIGPLGADGSSTIEIGGARVVMNAPTSDDDGRPRSVDGMAVARRVVAALRGQPLEMPAITFVDAACLLARAGEKLPAMADRSRQQVAELVVAAARREPARGEAVVRGLAGDVRIYAMPLVSWLPVADLAALARDGCVPTDVGLMRRLAPVDPVACAQLIDRVASPEVARALLGAAVLAVEDASSNAVGAGRDGVCAGRDAVDAGPLTDRWMRWEELPADRNQEERHAWMAMEVRRLARRDLEAAVALEARLPDEWSHDADASLAVAARLARHAPERATAIAVGHAGETDLLAWLTGCVRGGAPAAGQVVDAWIDALGPHTYDPYSYFAGVLEACLELGDPARVRRLIKAAGPTGWQIAHAARWELALAGENRSALLEVCLERHPPGLVSGRAVDRGAIGFHAGRMVVRPAWLALTDPHPVETLSVVAALGADGPAWTDRTLP